MPYRRTTDAPGTWHHVMNRGVARRSIFENEEDIRYFLSRIAKLVRNKEIEIHSYSLMTTHFHLLLRSILGKLSEALYWCESLYVRNFNKRRGRDGPLFRGRYLSRTIESDAQLIATARYIDHNPVEAKIIPRIQDYPYGSAYYYCQPSSPPWLSRSFLEAEVRDAKAKKQYYPGDYAEVFGKPLKPGEKYVIERKLKEKRPSPDYLDSLLLAPHGKVQEWLIKNTFLADGTTPGLILCSPKTIQNVVMDFAKDSPEKLLEGKQKGSWWKTMEIGLLRTSSGLRIEEIAHRKSIGPNAVSRRIKLHGKVILENDQYSSCAAAILEKALARDFYSGKLLSK